MLLTPPPPWMKCREGEAAHRVPFRTLADPMNEDATRVPWHYVSDFKGRHPGVKGSMHFKDSIIRYEERYPES